MAHPHPSRRLPAQPSRSKKAKPVLARVTPPGVAKLLLDEGTTPEQMDAITDSLLDRLLEPELAMTVQICEHVYRLAHPKAEFKPRTMAEIEKRRKALQTAGRSKS